MTCCLYIEDGTIHGAVAQKSYLEIFLAFHMMHWQNTDALKVLLDWKAAGINPLPERVETGVMPITAQFKHAQSRASAQSIAPRQFLGGPKCLINGLF